jgi:hypothetical protein
LLSGPIKFATIGISTVGCRCKNPVQSMQFNSPVESIAIRFKSSLI